MGTGATPVDLPDAIPRQILHFAAELCRFALPLGVMVVGMLQQHKRR
jgi:hypothetical protein